MYHEGELEAQRRAGTTRDAEAMAAGLHSALTPGVRRFLAERSYAFVAVEDPDGRPWISLAEAERGLFSCTAENELALVPEPRNADPVLDALRAPGRIAVLALDLATRRRLRVNGRSVPAGSGRAIVTPTEVFGNCPKYIARRAVIGARRVKPKPREVASFADLAESVRAADCVAFATTHASRGLDASHRGGPPGFLRMREDGAIEWDDYAGNGMFQSNGNLLADPRSALALPDFETGSLVLLTGQATVSWGSPRSTTFRPTHALRIEGAIRHVFSPPEPSPFLPDSCTVP